MWSYDKGVVGEKNFTFTRHKYLLLTVKEWLKSVLNYRSYPKNKTGYSFFGSPCIDKGRTIWCISYLAKRADILKYVCILHTHTKSVQGVWAVAGWKTQYRRCINSHQRGYQKPIPW